MSMADVGAQIHADARNQVEHETFGHLFPDKGYYGGTVRLANALYGDIVVMDERGLPASSPWWFDAINRFACDMAPDMEYGEVAEFDISVTIVECQEEDSGEEEDDWEPKKWQEIHICNLRKTILVKAY